MNEDEKPPQDPPPAKKMPSGPKPEVNHHNGRSRTWDDPVAGKISDDPLLDKLLREHPERDPKK